MQRCRAHLANLNLIHPNHFDAMNPTFRKDSLFISGYKERAVAWRRQWYEACCRKRWLPPRMLSPIVKGCVGHVHKIELAQAITGNLRHRTAQSCLNPQISFDVANFVLIGVTFSVQLPLGR